MLALTEVIVFARKVIIFQCNGNHIAFYKINVNIVSCYITGVGLT